MINKITRGPLYQGQEITNKQVADLSEEMFKRLSWKRQRSENCPDVLALELGYSVNAVYAWVYNPWALPRRMTLEQFLDVHRRLLLWQQAKAKLHGHHSIKHIRERHDNVCKLTVQRIEKKIMLGIIHRKGGRIYYEDKRVR